MLLFFKAAILRTIVSVLQNYTSTATSLAGPTTPYAFDKYSIAEHCHVYAMQLSYSKQLKINVF
jgi:hypothetical protein